MDKLAFYDQADRDSLKRSELLRSDPAFQTPLPSQLSFAPGGLNASLFTGSTAHPDQQLLERIGSLQQQLNRPTSYTPSYSPPLSSTIPSGEVERLEHLLQSMSKGNGSADPEMESLNGTLDKILSIQHPEERVQNASVPPVSPLRVTIDTDTVATGFYSLALPELSQPDNAIPAVVHETQTLVNGSVIKLRLLRSIFIGGDEIPAGQFVFGVVELAGERLTITIPSIVYAQNIYPVKLQVYDLDGLEGLYIPGTITRDAAKESSSNALQLMELSSADPSLKAQAAATGMAAAKIPATRLEIFIALSTFRLNSYDPPI